jgi:hypothetical protein
MTPQLVTLLIWYHQRYRFEYGLLSDAGRRNVISHGCPIEGVDGTPRQLRDLSTFLSE